VLHKIVQSEKDVANRRVVDTLHGLTANGLLRCLCSETVALEVGHNRDFLFNYDSSAYYYSLVMLVTFRPSWSW